ncbi:MAG: hypothetical protein ACK56F_14115 [bacterium]
MGSDFSCCSWFRGKRADPGRIPARKAVHGDPLLDQLADVDAIRVGDRRFDWSAGRLG